MRKPAIVLLVAALAVPAAADAKKPPPKQSKTAVTATKNAAKACAALRAANATLFRTTWGKNHNGRNAFGKCVSAHARAKQANPTFTLHNLTLNSTGTVTNAGATGCQFTAAGCTVTSTGTVTGAFGGTYSSTFTILWQTTGAPNPNAPGGFCADATGDVTLTFPGLGTLTKHEVGKVCETTATGANVPHSFTGTFTVTGGTGVFNGATGSGTASWSQQPGATSAQGGAVTGSETFETLTLKL
jgi:hypothetical protein